MALLNSKAFSSPQICSSPLEALRSEGGWVFYCEQNSRVSSIMTKLVRYFHFNSTMTTRILTPSSGNYFVIQQFCFYIQVFMSCIEMQNRQGYRLTTFCFLFIVGKIVFDLSYIKYCKMLKQVIRYGSEGVNVIFRFTNQTTLYTVHRTSVISGQNN